MQLTDIDLFPSAIDRTRRQLVVLDQIIVRPIIIIIIIIMLVVL